MVVSSLTPAARRVPWAAPVVALLLGLCATSVGAEEPTEVSTLVGGDLRAYVFQSTENQPGSGEDLELVLFRLRYERDAIDSLGRGWSFEAHGLFDATFAEGISARRGFDGGRSTVTGGTRHAIDLDHTVLEESDALGVLSVDRFNVRLERPRYRLTLGRQAVTWGVNYFWPVLDLFAPFAPQRIDRDYKPGVDALRATIATGDFSEIEVIAAAHGEELPEAGSLAALARFHSGRFDWGGMLGSFQDDLVVGLFLTADVAGSLLRTEVAYTDPDESDLTDPDHRSFVRATIGHDRQLSAYWSWTSEVHWNGFGVSDPAGYVAVATSDRFRRGEVTSPGALYAASGLGWQAHPLVRLSSSLLGNLRDDSVLLQLSGEWSTSDNTSVLFGANVGAGDDDLRFTGGGSPVPGSEYGSVPLTLWAAGRWSF